MSGSTSGDTNTCTLLVASAGDQLTELYALRDRFVGLGPIEWATFDSPHARELLAGETVHLVPQVHARDLRGAMSNLPQAQRLLSERRVGRVVSTGAGIAVPFLLTARRLGLPAHYVESAARATHPSLTGALVARIPGVHLYSQHLWREPGWSLRGSVFDGYVATPVLPPARLDRVVVTLGTDADSSFRAAAQNVAASLREIGRGTHEVLWQTGSTDVSGLDIDAHPSIPFHDLQQAVSEADLVISDAGVGSAMLALSTGKVPVLLPRRRHRGEHADDHQVELADALHRRGLAQHVEVDAVTPESLTAGLGRTALRTAAATTDFHLTAEHDRSARSVRRMHALATPRVVVPLQPQPEWVPALVVNRGQRPLAG
ncbi:MAG: glycosyl transferase family 28, partial [Nocardioidaceae bacterium]|nr:glycosyl transferase family 28 [Nocardioidaceae bacterium]